MTALTTERRPRRAAPGNDPRLKDRSTPRTYAGAVVTAAVLAVLPLVMRRATAVGRRAGLIFAIMAVGGTS